MPVPARPRQRRNAKRARPSPVVSTATLLITAAGAVAAAVLAPADARPWVLGTAVVAWCCVAAAVGTALLLVRRAARHSAALAAELEMGNSNWRRQDAEASRLADTMLPEVARQVKNGADADAALARVTGPSDPHLRRLLHLFATELTEPVRRAAAAESELHATRAVLTRGAAEVRQLTEETLPAAVALLREGSSADTVLTMFDWPQDGLLRQSTEWFVRELAYSERRSAAAQVASAKALSRVQAKTVSMLANLREMQERHGQEVFGDLLRLDHSTSQLGLLTDRLALLMGGRSSRVWNKPIVMESILRGAVGRIAAYRRVRLHSSSKASISGFAAEGVMHLLAELMDNAANFSPPIDEVHVYVEERSAGLVVTIEDSGLKMSDAAMRRAQESVSGKVTDLASLQGTRLGLAVVGRLAAKYGMSVNFRPSSRGGTGVVVLLPPQLMAQQREPVAAETHRNGDQSPGAPGPAVTAAATAAATATATATAIDGPPRRRPQPAAPTMPAAAATPAMPGAPATPATPATRRDAVPAPRAGDPGEHVPATLAGLPVRAPGRTMAAAERARHKPAARTSAEEHETGPARDAGSRFGAFHRGRQSAGGAAPGSTDPHEDPADD
jgi:signal transduction histidine kinase